MRNGVAALLLALAGAACSTEESRPASGLPPGPTPSVQRTSLGELPNVDVDEVLAHTKVLSSDQFEGRGPGTKGEELTVAYLIDQFRKLGLKPGNPDGTFVQKVPLVGITPEPASLVLKKDADKRSLKWKDDVVAWTKRAAQSTSLEDSELVFVGYGVMAPEFSWDDYKSVDVKGKTLVMLVNDPPVPDPANEGELDPKTFGGRAMTSYGHWTYKFETGARLGAAAVLLIHETGPAGYPFDVIQSKAGEQFELVSPDRNMDRLAVEAWITLDQARNLFTMAGQDFETLKRNAATREFEPVRLGVQVSMTIKNTLRTVTSRNVVAKYDGRDALLKDEFVIYTAHWDHLGTGPAVNGETIYHGAIDNASGTAGLIEIARAFTRLAAPPKRSILFLAVTANEQGLLGSEYYTATPLYPLARTAAVINVDELNVSGRTRDMRLIGLGASDLDGYAADAAGEQGRVIRRDAESEKHPDDRSDQFNFARQGVPALDLDGGLEFIGKPAGFGEKIRNDYTERDHHKPSDVVKTDWDLSGAREDLKVLFAVGYRVADAEKVPEWKPGNEFRARREEMLKSAK
jgi:Zn-dependent M28 family amino/carboxypeptidase